MSFFKLKFLLLGKIGLDPLTKFTLGFLALSNSIDYNNVNNQSKCFKSKFTSKIVPRGVGPGNNSYFLGRYSCSLALIGLIWVKCFI